MVKAFFLSLWGGKDECDAGTGIEYVGHYPTEAECDETNYQTCDFWTGFEAEKECASSSLPSMELFGRSLTRDEQEASTICACFLKDYEAGQPPTLSNNFSKITRQQLLLCRVKHSFYWNAFGLSLATILLFIPSFHSRWFTLFFHTYSILIFAADLYMKDQFLDDAQRYYPISGNAKGPFLLHTTKAFLGLMSVQVIVNFILPANSLVHTSTLAISVFKPVVFFYQSRRARDALEALVRISKKLLRVILIELFLILTFATVACRLYYDQESFQSLPQSWLSLFALSTTVVNPSIWMPAYDESRWNAIFFVIFIIVSIFYLHSLVLSVVFQVFVQSATEVHRRSTADKENSLKLAFLSLCSAKKCRSETTESTHQNESSADVRLICEAFRIVRPHYNQQKLNILMDIILPGDPNGGKDDRKHNIHFEEFQKRIHEALNSSIRTTRKHSYWGIVVEVLSISVSVLNFFFVIFYASRVRPQERSGTSEFILGSLITLLTLTEMFLRYNPWQFANRINPITRLNAVLDGMGCLGGFVSFIGIISYMFGYEVGMEYLLIGRAIGMIQSMRFSVWFREVLQRSLYVLPFLSGPLLLILTAMHVFVCLGMALWEGSVDVEEQSANEHVEYLYYLNNFNSYGEGCITVFNVLVVNDWHQIANVFIYANRCSSPFIVYLYFVMLVIVAVCILLNVIVAFFVETFVNQLSLVNVEDGQPEKVMKPIRSNSSSSLQSDFSMHIGPIAHSWIFDANDLRKKSVKMSSCPNTGETRKFDVIQREGFDEIMESVANDEDKQFEDFARNLLDAVVLINALSPERNEGIAHLICSRQGDKQFLSTNFSSVVKEYLPTDEDVQSIVRDMKDSLSRKAPSDSNSKIGTNNRMGRYIPNPRDDSKLLQIDGTLLPQNDKILILTAIVNELNQ